MKTKEKIIEEIIHKFTDDFPNSIHTVNWDKPSSENSKEQRLFLEEKLKKYLGIALSLQKQEILAIIKNAHTENCRECSGGSLTINDILDKLGESLTL